MPARRRFSLVTPFLTQVGELALLTSRTFRNSFRRPFEGSNFRQQLEEIGVRSLPVVSLTAAFGGLVFALQTYIGFHRYIGQGSEAYGGPILSVGLCRELIPILVGLMVSGRVGSAMAAEIGTMKITEQVDALHSLGADPNRYLVVPRVLASFLMLPLLTLYGDIIGIASGFIFNIYGMGVNRIVYLRNTLLYLELWDIASGMIKASIFGLMVSGRVGSAMAAEIGTMKITEQVDALHSLGANINRYLVVPRVLAGFLMLPLLTLYGDIIGITSGFIFNIYGMGVNRIVYLRNTLLYLELWDVVSGMLKAAIFGLMIAVIGCWQGLNTEGGAEGVGRATTKTVVVASIGILIVNFFLSRALPSTL